MPRVTLCVIKRTQSVQNCMPTQSVGTIVSQAISAPRFERASVSFIQAPPDARARHGIHPHPHRNPGHQPYRPGSGPAGSREPQG
ncbi:hypothetical protein BKM09_018255 [Pseudomonas amygdali pv. morsprunorum]|nr:hypothetical protein BKM19_006645 [Pseudomonas amygdali pv. morsprunorum]POP91051.1 hypothetical protein CXB39_20595 [Pseudomonas amygdali pv. morsprunorum]POY80489.1 hypothetical protein BKM09_018255 [Pseudomonas amygdali pv. morsprunorum]